MTRMGAHIEIIEPLKNPEEMPCIKPRVVLINGVDVGLIAKSGVQVNNLDGGNPDGAVEVVLTLLPKRVTIRAGYESEEQR